MDIAILRQKAAEWIGKYKYVALILLLGIGLMLIPNKKQEEFSSDPIPQQTTKEQTLAEQLEVILSNIQGAGRVKVMLTTKTGEKIVYQTDIPATDRQDTVIITDGNRGQGGLVQQIIAPTYRGAIVLCQGADSANVRLAIIEAVAKVTGLDSSQISVLKMK